MFRLPSMHCCLTQVIRKGSISTIHPSALGTVLSRQDLQGRDEEPTWDLKLSLAYGLREPGGTSHLSFTPALKEPEAAVRGRRRNSGRNTEDTHPHPTPYQIQAPHLQQPRWEWGEGEQALTGSLEVLDSLTGLGFFTTKAVFVSRSNQRICFKVSQQKQRVCVWGEVGPEKTSMMADNS